MAEHENANANTRETRRTLPPIEAPPVASSLRAHIPKADMHRVGDRITDIKQNAKASWEYAGEEDDKREGYNSLYRGARRLASFVKESRHAHKVRVAERAYADALRNMSRAHVKVELDPTNPDQQPIFDLIKKAGIPDAASNPYFIMELQGKKGTNGEEAEGTGTYVAYDPKLRKYVMYWQKAQLLKRPLNFAGREEFGASANGRMWFKDQQSYEAHLAKKAGELAAGMLSAPVERTTERRVLGYTERFNTFDRSLVGGKMKVPEGIAIIEMNEEGKLLVQGTPYLRATAREMQRLQMANTRRLNRERAEREEAARMQRSGIELQDRLAANNYRVLDVVPEQAILLNTWLNLRLAESPNLRNRNASVVYRDEAGNDIVLYSRFQNGERQWRVGVPEAMADGFNQQTIAGNLHRVPRRPATFNAFNSLQSENRPGVQFTLRDPDREGAFDDTVVQFRVSRNGLMFRMLHPNVREQLGVPETRIVTADERLRLHNAEVAERQRLRNEELAASGITNVELRDWMVTNNYVAQYITPSRQQTLTDWVETIVTPEQQAGRSVVISYRSGNSDLILHGTLNADGSRMWQVYVPENVGLVNQSKMLQNVIKANTESATAGSRLPDFIAGARTGTYPTDLVQIAVGRKLNSAGYPIEPGVGLFVTPPNARRRVSVAPTVTPVRSPNAATPPVESSGPYLREQIGLANEPEPLVFNDLARGEAPQLVSDTMNMFYSRWIDEVLSSFGVDSSRVIIEVRDPLTNEVYRIYKQNAFNAEGQRVSAVGLVASAAIDRNENALMSAFPFLADIRTKNVRILGNPPVSQDFTSITIEVSNGDPMITIAAPAIVATAAPIAVPAGSIFAPRVTRVSVTGGPTVTVASEQITTAAPVSIPPERPAESVLPLPQKEVSVPVSVEGFEHAVPVANEYIGTYVRDRVAEVLKQANINNGAPSVVRFKDESGKVVDLLVNGDSVSIVSQSEEVPADWYKSLAGNMQPMRVITTALDDTVSYNRIGIDLDAEKNVKAFVFPAVTAPSTATNVPAPVATSAPTATETPIPIVGTVFNGAPNVLSNQPVAETAAAIPVTARAPAPVVSSPPQLDLDALRRDLGIT